MSLPLSPYREPGREAPRRDSGGALDRGFGISLLVLAGWAALRVSSSVLRGQLDGEGAIAALLLALALHALVRRRPSF
jgi:hypothetical protein